jgi:hypothetical protein
MSGQQYDWFQAIPAAQFNPASLTGTFQPIFAAGFADNIKIMHIYNGGTTPMDYSFDGTTQHGVWPGGATIIVDFQTNHADNPPYGSGTLNGRQGQNVWVRTATNPTWLTIGGYR